MRRCTAFFSSTTCREFIRSPTSAKFQESFLPYGAIPRAVDATSSAPPGNIVGDVALPACPDPSSRDTREKIASLAAITASHCSAWPYGARCAVALDVDGVIYRQGDMIAGSREAVQFLHRTKIPFCFLTNSGGQPEHLRAQKLTQLTGVDIREDQIIQSSTPMQKLATADPVLIAGNYACLAIARRYGFINAVHILDLQKSFPELVPTKFYEDNILAETHFSLAKEPLMLEPPAFSAIFVFNDLTDVFCDSQVIIDVLTSYNGKIASSCVQSTQSVPLYISEDDLLYSAKAKLPRLSQGAMREMLSAAYYSVTGRALQCTLFGKPRRATREFGEGVLQSQRARIVSEMQFLDDTKSPLTIFMVGDNLETDIMLANSCTGFGGQQWSSVHVQTGISSAPSAVRTAPHGDAEFVDAMTKLSALPPDIASPSLLDFVADLAFKSRSEMTVGMRRRHTVV